MRLTKLYLRFFRSFNFDYERKADGRVKAQEWEKIGDTWFPFIRIDIDPAVTAVVGANESGKSHLIDAIKQGLTGEGIERGDFCRYSTLFSVEAGQVRVPDLGLELEFESDDDLELVNGLPVSVQRGGFLTLLRLGDGNNLLADRAGVVHELSTKQLRVLEAGLPVPFELETNVPLPDSITLDSLLGREAGPLYKRRQRFDLIELFRNLPDTTPEAVVASAAEIGKLLRRDIAADTGDAELKITPEHLGRSLLVDVAKIDRSAFEDLEQALRDGKEGRVGGLIEEMNRALARHLNFTRWWTQDRDFQLRLSPRERELVFTIRDRTGTDYSFRERSRGLTYFLSYFVQLQAHQQTSSRPEVLLMDEPDAYLSSVGQQDLLRALEHFARPDGGLRRDQVIYVTHSPFLINKNAAHRIRVLDKGSNEEGTRVVRDVARNHYEPLRSSIGGYVAETAFVGGANLLVEGVSDQVLLAGMTSLLRHRGIAPRRLLDLNDITIVPAGSASNVPYIAYLARGRDELKPPCVALLDGDQAGQDAERMLARSNDGKRKPILAAQFVINLTRWAPDVSLKVQTGTVITEPEDLIPVPVVVEAARSYARRLLQVDQDSLERLKAPALSSNLVGPGGGSMWRALQLTFAEAFDGAHIDKLGFAKEIVAYAERVRDDSKRPSGLLDLEHNFGELLAHLAERLSRAAATEAERRSNRRTDRLVKSFLADYPEGAPRDDAEHLLRELEASLEETAGDEAVRAEIVAIRRDFGLATDPLAQVPEYDDFRARLGGLRTRRRLAYREPDKAAGRSSGAMSD
jgi:predicted ATP-dependent endonuclease of OLD family